MEEGGEYGQKLNEELNACQHVLVDKEMEHGRYNVFIFQMSNFDTKIINVKFGEVFNMLIFAAKIIIALGFALQNNETGKYRYFYAHENSILLKNPLALFDN